jgi:hypothetical protein
MRHLVDVDGHGAKCPSGRYVEVNAVSSKAIVDVSLSVSAYVRSPDRVQNARASDVGAHGGLVTEPTCRGVRDEDRSRVHLRFERQEVGSDLVFRLLVNPSHERRGELVAEKLVVAERNRAFMDGSNEIVRVAELDHVIVSHDVEQRNSELAENIDELGGFAALRVLDGKIVTGAMEQVPSKDDDIWRILSDNGLHPSVHLEVPKDVGQGQDSHRSLPDGTSRALRIQSRKRDGPGFRGAAGTSCHQIPDSFN